jgi:hypothetical protein
VIDRDVLGSVDTEAGDTREGEQVVEVVDESVLDVGALGLKVGKPGELAVLDLGLVAPVVYSGGVNYCVQNG